MLAWCCDLIVASDDAQFICTSGKMGGSGIEFYAYPWEIGPRRAKMWLLTGELSAQKAEEYGMINEVVPRSELEQRTLALAEQLTKHTSWTLNMTKSQVNHAQDAQGRRGSMQYAFAVHQLGHAHRRLTVGANVDPDTLPENLRQHYLRRMETKKE
jgi:enoyl-CoA hydratase